MLLNLRALGGSQPWWLGPNERRAGMIFVGGQGHSYVFAIPPNSVHATKSRFLLEKDEVYVSIVHGTLSPVAIKQMRAASRELAV